MAQLQRLLAGVHPGCCSAFMRGWAGAAFASQAQPPLRTRRFVDWLRLEARAGDGGAGCVRPLTRRCRLSFWQASNKRGPDGGNGGHGGDVVLQADAALRCLAAVHGPALNASTGSRGGPQARQGRAGPALVVRVPVGTTVWQRLDVDGEDMDDADGGAEVPYGSMPSGAPPSGTGRNYRPALQLLADLTEHEATAVVARGGRGGKGNAAIGHAAGKGWQQDAFEPGTPGQVVPLLLELKAVADVGLVGAPNVGKSTLLATLSNARPEIGDYAFTTLRPQLGRVHSGGKHFMVGVHDSATVADIPGLIQGAHENRGLGHSFLRHVERCGTLVLVVDLSAGVDGRAGQRASGQLRMLLQELHEYDPSLATRPLVVVGTKLDVPGASRSLAGLRTSATAAALPRPLGVSALTGEGMDQLRSVLLQLARTTQQRG